jgi:hypothetical protein
MKPATEQAQHLVSLLSVEDDALGEELQVIWELQLGGWLIENVASMDAAGSKGIARPVAVNRIDLQDADIVYSEPFGPQRGVWYGVRGGPGSWCPCPRQG